MGRFRARAPQPVVPARALTAAMRQLRFAHGGGGTSKEAPDLTVDVLNQAIRELYPEWRAEIQHTGPGQESMPHQVSKQYLNRLELGSSHKRPIPEWFRDKLDDWFKDGRGRTEAAGSTVPRWLVDSYDYAFVGDGLLKDMYDWSEAAQVDQERIPPANVRHPFMSDKFEGALEGGWQAVESLLLSEAGFDDYEVDAPLGVRELVRSHSAALREIHHRLAAGKPSWKPSGDDRAATLGEGEDDVPDGRLTRPGEYLVYRWKYYNRGAVPWDNRLMYRVGEPSAGIHTPPFVPVPDTPPGAAMEIRCPMRAPEKPGTYRIFMKMGWPDGTYCFPAAVLGPMAILVVPPGDISECHSQWGSE